MKIYPNCGTRNALSPTDVTLLGIVMDSSPLSEKTYLPIISSVSGKTMLLAHCSRKMHKAQST
jgi:hypothetical protein